MDLQSLYGEAVVDKGWQGGMAQIILTCLTRSVQQKYYEGQAADCRKYVQQLNMKKGELAKHKDRLIMCCQAHVTIYSSKCILYRMLMPPDEYARYREDEVAEDNVTQLLAPTVVQSDKSKWSLYMHPKDDNEVIIV